MFHNRKLSEHILQSSYVRATSNELFFFLKKCFNDQPLVWKIFNLKPLISKDKEYNLYHYSVSNFFSNTNLLNEPPFAECFQYTLSYNHPFCEKDVDFRLTPFESFKEFCLFLHCWWDEDSDTEEPPGILIKQHVHFYTWAYLLMSNDIKTKDGNVMGDELTYYLKAQTPGQVGYALYFPPGYKDKLKTLFSN